MSRSDGVLNWAAWHGIRKDGAEVCRFVDAPLSVSPDRARVKPVDLSFVHTATFRLKEQSGDMESSENPSYLASWTGGHTNKCLLEAKLAAVTLIWAVHVS